MDFDKGELLFYQAEDGNLSVDVRLEDDSVWLSQQQMADLFDRNKSVISRHLRNIYQTGELKKEGTVAKYATVQKEGDRQVARDIEYYNLDTIVSVGYRVNSIRGTQFRIWATTVLKEHLVEGFTVNQQRLAEKGVQEAKQVLNLLAKTLTGHELVNDEGQSVLDIVNRYAVTWRLLLQYDEDRLPMPDKKSPESVFLETSRVRDAIDSLKNELLQKGEATELFGNERNHGLEGIFGAIYQTFEGIDLYSSREEKAANLLYFIIKDHPFSDGNKRIGSFLFLMFLQANGMLDDLAFDNKALVALTLLTASSDPPQKELMIRLIVNLLT